MTRRRSHPALKAKAEPNSPKEPKQGDIVYIVYGGISFRETGANWAPEWVESAPFAFCPIFASHDDAQKWSDELFLGTARVISFPWDRTVVDLTEVKDE